MRNALAAGLIIAVVCSTLSFFVYLRRLAFVASGIAHGAFAGVAIGLIAGWEPMLSAAAVALVLGLAVAGISQRGGIAQDSATGIASTAAMALGVVMLGLARGYVPDVFGYLFGSILAVDGRLLGCLAGGAAVVLAVVAALFRPLLYTALDRDSAEAAGLPVATLDYLLLGLMSLTVVAAVRLLGIVLATALLVTPAATAFRITRNYRGMLAGSIAAGAACTVAGLAASYRWDLPPGATIALGTAGAFAAASALAGLSRTARRRLQPRYEVTSAASASASAHAADSGTKSSPSSPEPPLAPHITVGMPIEQGPPASNDPRP